jgi:hypothetical protein
MKCYSYRMREMKIAIRISKIPYNLQWNITHWTRIRTAITLTINPHLFSTGGLTLSIELELDAALALLFVIGSHSSAANRILLDDRRVFITAKCYLTIYLDAALDHF